MDVAESGDLRVEHVAGRQLRDGAERSGEDDLAGAELGAGRPNVFASHCTAWMGWSRHAAPAPVDTTRPFFESFIPARDRSIPSSFRGVVPSTKRPLEALSAIVSS